MSKADWLAHITETGIARDRATVQAHAANCRECAKRRATKRSNASRRMRDDVARSCGLVKVRGALGGVYYE